MNMSDDVAGAALQMGTKAADVAAHVSKQTIDLIAKLIQALIEKSRQNTREKKANSTDLSDIKPGKVKINELRASARKNGDSISYSENGFTKKDANIIADMAKKNGIPVAITGNDGKDNVYISVRTSDMPIFQRVCTDMIKDKLAERPQELGNFKCQKWEMPYLANELSKNDLSAQFAVTKNGEYMCVYEKTDEKAIHIARNEFVNKCNSVNRDISIEKIDDNFYSVKDLVSGKQVTFDEIPTKKELSEHIQEQFGYEKSKADIACAKFGEEQLSGKEKYKFFSNDPQNEFSKIDTNITLENESIYAKEHTCWRLTFNDNKASNIIFRDSNGNFAVLDPEHMTRSEMREELKSSLKLDDKNIIDALTEKAEKVSDHYSKQDEKNFSNNYDFKKSDFDLSDPVIASGMARTENGETFTKSLPINNIENNIERTGKNEFKVDITAKYVETDSNMKEHTSFEKNMLVLSFSDKKNAVKELSDIYRKNGVPDHIAKQMAKETFAKAENQSAEKVVSLEEIKENKTALVAFGGRTIELDLQDHQEAINKLKDEFGISDTAAEKTIEKAEEKLNENSEKSTHQRQNTDTHKKENITKDEKVDTSINLSNNNSRRKM